MILDVMTYSIIAIVAVMSYVVIRLAWSTERSQKNSDE
jgi:hypothetical protein